MSWFRKAELSALQKQQIQGEVDTLYGPHADVFALYNATSAMVKAANFPENQKYAGRLTLAVIDEAQRRFKIGDIINDITMGILRSAAALYACEQLTEDLPDYRLLEGTSLGIYKDMLLSWQHRAANPAETLGIFQDTFVASFLPVVGSLPQLAIALPEDGPEGVEYASIPLITFLPNIGHLVEAMIEPYYSSRATELGLFRYVRSKLDDNQKWVNEGARGRTVRPSEHPGTPREIVEAYLRDTFLEKVFEADVPFDIFLEDRLEHTAIIAGTGWGKTQLLQHIIANDLSSEHPPAMVIVDSTGAMVQRIQRLAVFNDRLKDRLLIIDPELDPVPALNPFDVANERFARYSATDKERLQTEIIDLFNYVFSTVNNPLTTRVQTAFAFMVRLLLSIPNANIHTLLQLLDDDPKGGVYEQATFKPHIDKMDPTTQHFFKVQYYTGRDGGLREQIRARVFDILRVPAFERMFVGVNKVDFFSEINRGTIIVVNTSENLLKEGSTTFGRYIIARVMAAAFERAPMPPETRRPTFLLVDEAAQYFDETFDKLLNRVRQFKLGVVIAFQNTQQANDKLKASIASSTAVKYAAGTSFDDARWLAREMRCDPDFILAQKRDGRPPKWAQFACYVRNFTSSAVSLTVPFFTLEQMPQMTDAEHAQLLERNRARVTAPASVPERVPPAPPPEAAPVDPSTAALAKAYADLADAIGRSDWTRASELKDSIIPELTRKSTPLGPRPASPSPEKPRPAAASRDGPLEEGTTEWR